jgi:molecular chaperone GrpE
MAEQEEKNKDIKTEGQEPEAKKKEETTSSEKCATEKAEAQEADTKETEKKAEEEKQEDPLEKANKEIADLKDKYLRTLAEFDNYKKRTLKEKAELILNGSEKTVKAVLPVLDDFERALQDKSEDPKAIKEGVQMIFNKFVKALQSLGVKKIDTDGKDFDTDFHEAVAMVPGMGDEKKGKVIDCVQTGYTLNDKVIRHAKVAVGQ